MSNSSAVRVLFAAAIVAALSGWVLAQQKSAPAPTVTRTVLNQQDLAIPGYALAVVRVDLPVGAREGRHQHPGTLIAQVQEGVMTLNYEGKGEMQFKPGETFYVAPGTIHEGMNKGTVPVRLLGSFVFPKDKPMTIPVQ
jgi:quercetin dioxygenase-like cupin family protein